MTWIREVRSNANAWLRIEARCVVLRWYRCLFDTIKIGKMTAKWEIRFHTVFNEVAVRFCIVRTSEGDNALIFPVWCRPARIYWQHSFIFSQVEPRLCVCVWRWHTSDLSVSTLTRKKQGGFHSKSSDLRTVQSIEGIQTWTQVLKVTESQKMPCPSSRLGSSNCNSICSRNTRWSISAPCRT